MDGSREPLFVVFIILAALIVIFLIPVLRKSSSVTEELCGDNEYGEQITARAKILSKSTYTPNWSVERMHFIIFEKENGERIEMVIKDDAEYKMMFEGDVGTLTHIGKKYISFTRNKEL